MTLAATWAWVLAGAGAFLVLGLLSALALGLLGAPAEGGRRARTRLRAPRTERGVPLPDEVPDRPDDEPGAR